MENHGKIIGFNRNIMGKQWEIYIYGEILYKWNKPMSVWCSSLNKSELAYPVPVPVLFHLRSKLLPGMKHPNSWLPCIIVMAGKISSSWRQTTIVILK